VSEERILDVVNASKRYGGLVAVDNVNIHLRKNEILGLIGANGAGKTTLFNMISGNVSASSGKIIFQGREIQSLPSHKICRLGIGRTYQIVQPFGNLTVLENVIAGALMRHPRVKDARELSEHVLKVTGLEEFKDTMAKDLTLVRLKRMEVARALATEPEILLLDEVMAGINPAAREGFIQLVRDVQKTGISIIIIEHVMRVIMNLSDRVYVLNRG
jgi:branched-chain amino acid transport system ATP-binding protein